MNNEEYAEVVETIVGDLKVSSSDDGLYAAHYTSGVTPRTLLRDENSNRMWQFSCDYMNDPQEGRYLVDLMVTAAKRSNHQFAGEFVERLTKLRNERLLFSAYKRATFISCWTLVSIRPANKGDSDSLNHWRFYGDDGRGACIMLPVRHISKIFPKELFHVVYGMEGRGGGSGAKDRPANRLREALTSRFDSMRLSIGNAIDDLEELLEVTHPLLFLFKSPEYREEKEIRSLVHKSDYSLKSGVKFHGPPDGSVKKAYVEGRKGLIGDGAIIFFGPKSDQRYAIEAMGLSNNLGKQVEVLLSSKPYR
jgi:hypothetical protein